jgi:hypothetical protein
MAVGSVTARASMIVALLLVGAVGRGRAADYSGGYYVTVGVKPRFEMVIDQTGNAATFTLSGGGFSFSGTATVSDLTMIISADLGASGSLSGTLTFASGGESFSGTWESVSETPARGTMTGARSPWGTFDLDSQGTPVLATADCIDLAKIGKISRFRSGEGHDYSDDFETCRSMKHYYYPLEGVERSSIRLYSPVSGTIIGTNQDAVGQLWKGTNIGIRPHGQPAFDVSIFHVDLIRNLGVGDSVEAGEELGTSEKTSGTVSDVAVGVHTPTGYRLLSYFVVASQDVFAHYQVRGVSSREQLVVTREERDAFPLSCDGEYFVDRGTIENWVYLTPPPQRRRLRRWLLSAPRVSLEHDLSTGPRRRWPRARVVDRVPDRAPGPAHATGCEHARLSAPG